MNNVEGVERLNKGTNPMKTIIILFFISSISLFAEVDGIVTATKLNIRVKPGTNYAVVAQSKKGEKLQIISQKAEWYEIAAPADSKVFVRSSFIENGSIKKTVHLRSGPSVAYSSFRLAEKGEPVKVIDKSRKDWFQIAPPKGLTAWTSAKYIYLTPKNATKLTGKKLTKKTETIPETNKQKPETKTADKKRKRSSPFH